MSDTSRSQAPVKYYSPPTVSLCTPDAASCQVPHDISGFYRLANGCTRWLWATPAAGQAAAPRGGPPAGSRAPARPRAWCAPACTPPAGSAQVSGFSSVGVAAAHHFRGMHGATHREVCTHVKRWPGCSKLLDRCIGRKPLQQAGMQALRTLCNSFPLRTLMCRNRHTSSPRRWQCT
jgi:hypothetical protein